MRLLVALFFLLPAVGALASPKKCAVAGDVVHWAADYCLYLAGTDDFASEDVQACFAKQPRVQKTAACAAKQNYKRKICELLVRNGSYEKPVKQCLSDPSIAGPTVRNGGL